MNEPNAQPNDPTPDGAGRTPEETEQDIGQIQQQSAEAEPDDDGILTVSAEELQLPTPVLDEPVISEDVAAEASLSEVEAETRAVQQLAEKAGTLAGGPSVKSGSDKEEVQDKIEAAASKARTEISDGQET